MNEIRNLVENSVGPCVSVFMPTHIAGEQIRQDPIRLKNLIKEAEVRLVGMGLSSQKTKQLLSPINKLLRRTFFWRHQSDGLAIFSAAGFFRLYRLPVSFNEFVVVTHTFHIKPLLSLLASDGRFYVLALSQNKVRLLECTRYSASEIVLEDMPERLADVLTHDFERNLQMHSAAPVRQGERSAIFHGHGRGIDDTKANILKYFCRIDSGLSELLINQQVPLVIAGVDYLLPLYAKANTYKYLMDDGVKGNPEELSADELRDRAWAIVEPHFLKTRKEAIARYQELSDTSRVSSDLTEIVLASNHGRVDLLFVAVGVQSWGTFDLENGQVNLHQAEQPGDQDLMDFAAIHTLLNGGIVFALPLKQMPSNAKVAAVFRY